MAERLSPLKHDSIDGVPDPAENAALFGHQDVAHTLATAYRAGKLSHALLFTGPVGIGKATLAFRLAHHVLSHADHLTAPEDFLAPDTGSALFRQIAIGSHSGLLHLTRPENAKTKGFKTVLTVDEIRKVSRFLSMTSHDGGYRVVIVDPADDLNTNAANALLKNLEEPPARTLFILIAHAPGRLLPTIRSRCQVIRMAPLGPADLLDAIDVFEALPADQPSRLDIVSNSGGSVRAGLLLARHGGREVAATVSRLATASTLDHSAIYRLAESVGGRDSVAQFDIFNNRALELLADGATLAAQRGETGRADRLARRWQDTRAAIDQTATYNLDRKQHALNVLMRLHESLRM